MDITAPADRAEAFTAWLFGHIQYGWEEVEEPGRTVFRVHLEDPAFAQGLRTELAARWPDLHVAVQEVPRRDWALAWREFFTAVVSGEDFVVVAPWMVDEVPYPDRIPIVIEPKMAFGTGHHPTTDICLAAVSQLHRAGKIRPGMRFLDLGTGSGILGLGCAKLGLTGIGLDTDPLAIDNALENKALNGVAEALELHAGGIEALHEAAPGERFDLVLANILAEPLVELAPQIVAALKPGGCLVLSGLLVIQAPTVSAAYAAQGLPRPRQVEEGEWAALVYE